MDSQYTISDKMWEGHQKRKERNRKNGKGFGYSLFNANSTYTSTISARYWKDGSEILIDQSKKGLNRRVLTPVEAGKITRVSYYWVMDGKSGVCEQSQL